MKEAETLHRRAIELIDSALARRADGDLSAFRKTMGRAFHLEKEAALRVARSDLEPSRSILLRSAAQLALDCEEPDAALELASLGLTGSPPDRIAAELREIQKAARQTSPPQAAEVARRDPRTAIKTTQILFEKYARAIERFFRGRGFSREDAKDLTQETFFRVHKGSATFRHESEWGYLRRIAENVGINALRSQTAAKRAGIEQPLPDQPSTPALQSGGATAEEELLRRERVDLLRAAIDELPPHLQRSMKMRIYEDLKYREIAVALKISMDSVKKRLYEARKAVVAKVGGWVDEQFPD